MRVIIKDNYTQVSKWAAEHVIEKINAFKPTKQKPFVLGLPTGSTPIGMYLNLVKAYREGRVSFKNVVTFNMDEYVGLAPTHDQSYHYFMHNNLFDHIDCPPENIHILNGLAEDLIAECEAYEAEIAKYGGINLFIGGIGPD
ncbi:MAG: 6-phosphogluconolactonase, partial [Bacteroidaceae bacterium]|nr:6-phosphogluconolactonase [Bacteroidaceae bacterium]